MMEREWVLESADLGSSYGYANSVAKLSMSFDFPRLQFLMKTRRLDHLCSGGLHSIVGRSRTERNMVIFIKSDQLHSWLLFLSRLCCLLFPTCNYCWASGFSSLILSLLCSVYSLGELIQGNGFRLKCLNACTWL